MQAKDLVDKVVIVAVETMSMAPWFDGSTDGLPRSVCTWSDLEPLFPDVPPKVLNAKLRKLKARGLLDGCACGCRGDWRVTDAGAVLL